jgi:hypothetical protein
VSIKSKFYKTDITDCLQRRTAIFYKYTRLPIMFRHIKSIGYILRYSCVLLAGIYSTQDGFPIKDFGNDGVGNENGGNRWVIR